MAVAYMNKGQELIMHKKAYTIDRYIGGELQLTEVNTSRAIQVSLENFYEKLESGDISFPDLRPAYIPKYLKDEKGNKIAATLDQYPQDQKDEMKRRRFVLETFIKKFGDVRSQSKILSGVGEIWNSAWGKVPHPATIARWIKRY